MLKDLQTDDMTISNLRGVGQTRNMVFVGAGLIVLLLVVAFVFVILLQDDEDDEVMFLGAGVLVFMIAAVIVVAIVVLRNAGANDFTFSGISAEDALNNMLSAAEEHDIPRDVMKDAINREIEEEKKNKKRCIVPPLLNGLCGAGYYLENGCCYASDPKTNQTLEKLQLARDIGTELAIGLAAGEILEYMLKKGLNAAGTRAAAASGTAATRAAASAAKAARAAAAAAKAARAIAVGTAKASAGATKYGVAASAGPPGWIAAALMLLFDAVSATLDLLDIDGYDSFTPQKTIENIRNIVDYSMASEFEKLDMGYPFMFPITVAFPEEMLIAQEYMTAQISAKYMATEIELPKHEKAKVAFDAFVTNIADNPDNDLPVPEEYINFITQMLEDKHLDRDKAIFTKLKELLGDQAYKIEFYESISAPDRMGVSLSQQGAKEWNSTHEAEWLEGIDMDDPANVEISVMPCACYTDTYYIYESGDAKKPNMVARKLPQKTVLGNYYGPLLSYCEKVRKQKGTSSSVNPKALGTRFNFDTGVCEFSRDMCKRYGLEFKDNDCKPKPGQGVAEMIFGTTITRASVRTWDKRKDDFNSGDPNRVMLATASTILDPTGILTTGATEAVKSYARKSTPAVCKEGDSRDGPGGLCHNACRSGYKREGVECAESCPSGSTSTVSHCTDWTPSKSFVVGTHRNKCYSQYDGTGEVSRGASTCSRGCKEGFTRRSNALGSAFCNKTRHRYAAGMYIANACPEGYDDITGVCYEKCKKDERNDGLFCKKA